MFSSAGWREMIGEVLIFDSPGGGISAPVTSTSLTFSTSRSSDFSPASSHKTLTFGERKQEEVPQSLSDPDV